MTTLLIIWNVLLTAGVLLLWNRYLKQHEKIVNLKYDLQKVSKDYKSIRQSADYTASVASRLDEEYERDNLKHNQMYLKIFDQLNKKAPRRPMTAEDLDFEMKEDEPDEIKEKNVKPVVSPMGPIIVGDDISEGIIHEKL